MLGANPSVWSQTQVYLLVAGSDQCHILLLVLLPVATPVSSPKIPSLQPTILPLWAIWIVPFAIVAGARPWFALHARYQSRQQHALAAGVDAQPVQQRQGTTPADDVELSSLSSASCVAPAARLSLPRPAGLDRRSRGASQPVHEQQSPTPPHSPLSATVLPGRNQHCKCRLAARNRSQSISGTLGGRPHELHS